RDGASGVELRDLFRGQRPADRAEVLPQLLFIARADDDRRDRWPVQQPVQRNLRNRLARLLSHSIQSIYYLVQILILNRRPHLGGLVQAANFGNRLPAADLAGETSPSQWTPHQRANLLVQAERHEFPLILASDQ